MRIRSLVTIALVLPSLVSAQRRMGGRIGGGRPAPPAALPPTAGTIAREMSYVPRPYSVESYMFVSYMQQPMARTNALTGYGTMNAGTRLDYRINDYFSATGDMTSSLFYTGVQNGTVELGTRFLPAGRTSEARLIPFGEKSTHAAVLLRALGVSVNQSAVGHGSVGDPQLAAVQ